MLSPLRICFAAALVAAGLSCVDVSAQANLVINGSFDGSYIGSAPKNYFGVVRPTGWSGGYGDTFLDAPGTAANGTYLSVYGPFPYASPVGGNFVEADGDPIYSSAIYQTISGLKVGQAYTLTFYQAAGQQAGYTGATTEEWAVTFGSVTEDSQMYSLATGGVGAWEFQTMTFVASATSQMLSFLAVGTPNGAPPISFLDGVDLEVPEPASLALFSIGVLGVAAVARRRAGRTAAQG